MTLRIITTAIKTELDVVSARQRARHIAQLCGFGTQDQVRIATSVSELARNVYEYAGSGSVRFLIEGETAPQILVVDIEDQGPGIANLAAIMAGDYRSPTGMGKGLMGAKRLMDRCDIDTRPGAGTKIRLQKLFPRTAPLITASNCSALFAGLASQPADVALTEVLQQNQELLNTLAELKARQDDLLQLTRELEDTNRGVVALYAELDEKADHLRRADAMKSRFLSNMSHEFRTPLSSIRALAKLLLDRVDGELSVEQEKQVLFILQAAVSLNDLVNDLLDIAKIEAGKVVMRPAPFDVVETFSALRGMLRPLLVSESLKLTFVDPTEPLQMYSDEAKLSQILRNFISNALKFTEAGEITVTATVLSEQDQVRLSVADTGVGIAPTDLELIFEEFSQIENARQRTVKGTGLGLPLCRNLAALLGGRVEVESQLGAGSTFSVVLPRNYSPEEIAPAPAVAVAATEQAGAPVLIIDDNEAIRHVYERYLTGSEFRPIMARNLREGADLMDVFGPVAVVLDILLQGEDAWPWLAQVKNDPLRRRIPIIVATEVEDRRKGLSLGADAYFVKPLQKSQLLNTLRTLVTSHPSAYLAADQIS